MMLWVRAAEAKHPAPVLPFENGDRPLVKYPQKRPLIRLTTRPPQLETPFSVFGENIITPNDAFFVRYHLAGIPTSIEIGKFRLEVKGKVKTPLTLTVSDLKTQFEPQEIVAVNQCSGSSRGFSQPRVGGGQLGNGAMGNARWKGVSLKNILNKSGVLPGARQVTFNGLDQPIFPTTPDFVKALDLDHALDGEVMVAYSMNDADLPMLNGYPVRLVVPGYFGTYWVKHLTEITLIDDLFKGFWISTAYRVPDNNCHCIPPGTSAQKTVPISRLAVRSFITSLTNGSTVQHTQLNKVKRIAFDGGSGIKEVVFSSDGGVSWSPARLGKDLGKYSFREWEIPLRLINAGTYELKVRATNGQWQVQPVVAAWNSAGYLRNAVETTQIRAI